MLWPLLITAFAVTRSSMRTGRGSSYNVEVRMQTPKLLTSRRGQERAIEAIANGLALVNVEYLNERPNTPALFDSGVFYCDDGKFKTRDPWNDIPTTLEKGCGNCTAIVGWRLAELWRQGYNDAEADAIHQTLPNGKTLFHLRIRYGNGATEDPSQVLGMQS